MAPPPSPSILRSFEPSHPETKSDSAAGGAVLDLSPRPSPPTKTTFRRIPMDSPPGKRPLAANTTNVVVPLETGDTPSRKLSTRMKIGNRLRKWSMTTLSTSPPFEKAADATTAKSSTANRQMNQSLPPLSPTSFFTSTSTSPKSPSKIITWQDEDGKTVLVSRRRRRASSVGSSSEVSLPLPCHRVTDQFGIGEQEDEVTPTLEQPYPASTSSGIVTHDLDADHEGLHPNQEITSVNQENILLQLEAWRQDARAIANLDEDELPALSPSSTSFTSLTASNSDPETPLLTQAANEDSLSSKSETRISKQHPQDSTEVSDTKGLLDDSYFPEFSEIELQTEKSSAQRSTNDNQTPMQAGTSFQALPSVPQNKIQSTPAEPLVVIAVDETTTSPSPLTTPRGSVPRRPPRSPLRTTQSAGNQTTPSLPPALLSLSPPLVPPSLPKVRFESVDHPHEKVGLQHRLRRVSEPTLALNLNPPAWAFRMMMQGDEDYSTYSSPSEESYHSPWTTQFPLKAANNTTSLTRTPSSSSTASSLTSTSVASCSNSSIKENSEWSISPYCYPDLTRPNSNQPSYVPSRSSSLPSLCPPAWVSGIILAEQPYYRGYQQPTSWPLGSSLPPPSFAFGVRSSRSVGGSGSGGGLRYGTSIRSRNRGESESGGGVGAGGQGFPPRLRRRPAFEPRRLTPVTENKKDSFFGTIVPEVREETDTLGRMRTGNFYISGSNSEEEVDNGSRHSSSSEDLWARWDYGSLNEPLKAPLKIVNPDTAMGADSTP